MKSHMTVRGACLSAATAAFIILGATGAPERREAHALPKFDPPGTEGGSVECDPLDVEPVLELVGVPRAVGYPIVGFTAEIDARHVKISGRLGDCGAEFVHPLDGFAWSIQSQPAGSTATLTQTDTLAPRIRLDRAGTFVVRLTACPQGCPVLTPAGQSIALEEPPTLDVEIVAVPSAPLAPETMPVLPDSPATLPTPQERNNCGTGAGFVSPQWYAVEQIEGPADYKLLEGVVRKSRVSRKDSPTNHDSQDVNFHVVPDARDGELFFDEGEETTIEVEWERSSFPELYRPTQGDRVSVFGHWIYDCAHSSKTEIHPPVGVAVHRARPIAIPSNEIFPEFDNQTVGSGVYVPGTISDIFFSTDGGRLVDCSVDTGLRNADLQTVTGPSGQPVSIPTCIPPPSLDHVFEFNIYLPRNPQVTMAQAGFAVPPVPFYVKESTPPGEPAEDRTTVERNDTAEGITYLTVRVDLRGYPRSRYARRIVAGWVLPAANNWGLARWRLLLNRLNITNDGDGAARGDGDWRLWVNTNNASSEWHSTEPRQEWVQILNQDVHGVEDFGGSPWVTALDAPRSLGPELLRYPPAGSLPAPRDYGILFHTTGYEADGVVDDDAGTINMKVAAAAGSYERVNTCTVSGATGIGAIDAHWYSGCVRYSAEFEVVPGTPLPAAIVNRNAQQIASRYVLSCPRGAGSDDVGVCEGILARPVELPIVHPLDLALDPGSGPVEVTTIGPFRPGEREFALTEVSIEEFNHVLSQTRRTDPGRVERLVARLRSYIDEMRKDRALAVDADAELLMLEVSLPRDLWTRHFGDIPTPRPNPDLPKDRVTGSAVMTASSGGTVRTTALLLHCAVQRLPNKLTLRSGPNCFELDLALEARCGTERIDSRRPLAPLLQAPVKFLRVQSGRGMGRFNDTPGALVEWRLVDGGEPGHEHDTAAVTIQSGGAVVIQASGEILRGNVQAHWK